MDYIYEAEVSLQDSVSRVGRRGGGRGRGDGGGSYMIAGSMLFGRTKEVAFEGEYP